MSTLALFEEKQVRRAWNQTEEKWYFAIVDVIDILTGSDNPQVYWRVMKKRLSDEGNETVTNCNALKMTAADGKQRLTDVADTEQLLRLIQSIPSPKAEPFKLWLAKVGYERLEEIENPELAAKRMRQIYEQKGYSEDWIEKRLRGTAVRDELTDEWKKRGVKEQKEFAILTAEISKATFGITCSLTASLLRPLQITRKFDLIEGSMDICGFEQFFKLSACHTSQCDGFPNRQIPRLVKRHSDLIDEFRASFGEFASNRIAQGVSRNFKGQGHCVCICICICIWKEKLLRQSGLSEVRTIPLSELMLQRGRPAGWVLPFHVNEYFQAFF